MPGRGRPFEKGNPGRPKGIVPKCVQVKNDFFKAYFKLGGMKNFLTLFTDKRVCPTCGKEFALDDPLLKCNAEGCTGTIKFHKGKNTEREFFFRVLPQLMPKKLDIDGNLTADVNVTPAEDTLTQALLKAQAQGKLDIPTE